MTRSLGVSFVLSSLVLSCSAALGATTPVVVSVTSSDDKPIRCGTSWIRIVPTGGDEGAASPAEIAVEIPGQLTANLQPGSVYGFSLSAEHCWAADTSLYVTESQPNACFLSAFPTGSVHGRLTSDERLPAEIRIELEPAAKVGDSTENGPRGHVSCKVSDEGLFRCQIPTGRLNLKLRAAGHVSHFFWDVDLLACSEHSMGTLALKQGASLVGWVVDENGAPVEQGCRARLTTTDDLAPDAGSQPSHTISVGEHGFFHIGGIPPGSYALEVTKQGFAPTRVFPVVIRDTMEAVLRDPLVLHPPALLELLFEPATDPWRKQWQVELQNLSEDSFLGKHTVPEHGELALELAPGHYLLAVTDPANRVDWLSQRVTVEPGGNRYEIALSIVPIAGTISMAGEPLAADVWFGGADGSPRVHLQSDEEGAFAGLLPGHGAWPVDVGFGAGSRIGLETIDIEEPDSPGDVIEVELVVPDTSVEGVVVNHLEEPVPGAWVDLQAIDTPDVLRSKAKVRAGEDGRFSAKGLLPGTYLTTSSHRGSESDTLTTTIREGETTPFMTLVLREMSEYSGLVRAANGTLVAGARVTVRPVPVNTGPSVSKEIVVSTGATGRYTVRLPKSTKIVDASVFAHGFALGARRANVSPDRPLIVELSRRGGSLEVQLNGFPQHVPKTGVNIFYGDVTLHGVLLTQWARFQGHQLQPEGALVAPMMPAGRYTACLPQVLIDGRQGPGVCDEGTLSPSGKLVLALHSDLR